MRRELRSAVIQFFVCLSEVIEINRCRILFSAMHAKEKSILLNQTRIAELVGGRSPSVLAGPGYVTSLITKQFKAPKFFIRNYHIISVSQRIGAAVQAKPTKCWEVKFQA